MSRRPALEAAPVRIPWTWGLKLFDQAVADALWSERARVRGVVVDLGNDIEGFVPMSQLGIPDVQNPAEAVREGQAAELKVLEVDPIHHRIVVAATGWPKEEPAAEESKQ